MKLGRWIEHLTAGCVIGGGLLLAADFRAWPSIARAAGDAGTAGIGLLLIGGAAGLTAHRIAGRNARRLAGELKARAADAQGHALLDAPESGGLAPLMRAVNEALDGAAGRVDLAVADAKRLQVQLQVSRQGRHQAETILHAINDAVVVTDKFDEVLLANDAATRALGLDAEKCLRQPVDQVFGDPNLAQLIRAVRQNESGAERRVVEHRVPARGPGKPEKVFKVTLAGISNGGASSPSAEQQGGGVVTVLTDVTREAEIAKMKNDFVSSVSHELRTPLASIRAYVELLVDGEASDERTAREFYEIIQGEANRLGRMIDDILSISRIESGLVEVHRQPLSASLLVKDAVEVIRPQAKMKSIEVDEHLGPALYQVMADKELLHQAVLNLLSNAVKYTRDGGKVTVRVAADEVTRRLSVKVSDTGVGIPAKDLPRLFEKFFRVEANKSVAKGTGLGLSLVRNIVEVTHKGKMTVESEQGVGSTFGFELDLC